VVDVLVERFKDAPAAYRRFREHVRMAPEGLVLTSLEAAEKLRPLL
jgi:hypothetical protein